MMIKVDAAAGRAISLLISTVLKFHRFKVKPISKC